MLGGNDMAILLITVGVILVYISSVVMVLEKIREKRKLLWFDWIIAFVPIVRVIHLSREIEED